MNLKEIAKLAEVSPSTVSLVLNDKPGTGAATRARVKKLLEENGYHIAPAESREGESRSIRFLKYSRHSHLVNGNAGFVAAIIDSVEEEARRRGYNLVMTTVEHGRLPEVLETVRAEPLDGIILLATEADGEMLPHLQDIGVPLVAVDNQMEFENCSIVDMNNAEATRAGVRHLVELGHTEIGYFYNALPSSNCRARLEAFREALAYHGLPLGEEHIYTLPPTMEGAFDAMAARLEDGAAPPRAMMATNDTIAIGAIRALTRHGLRVPQDVSVVGFDDVPYAAVTDPPLTTMNVSCRDMGRWAVRLLCERIRYPAAPVTKILISPALVVRGSTCARQ